MKWLRCNNMNREFEFSGNFYYELHTDHSQGEAIALVQRFNGKWYVSDIVDNLTALTCWTEQDEEQGSRYRATFHSDIAERYIAEGKLYVFPNLRTAKIFAMMYYNR